jgi:hypothetical protein
MVGLGKKKKTGEIGRVMQLAELLPVQFKLRH